MHRHIDWHHKLIRWKFVIHGGMYLCDQMTMFIGWHNDIVFCLAAIDGYSRLVTYLQCSDNNRANTVHKLFIEACREYSVPSRVRCDFGGENVDTACWMIENGLWS